MVIEGFTIGKGSTVKRMPVGTEILSVCPRKEFEIGRVEDRVFITIGLFDDKVAEMENREFVVVNAETAFVADDYQFHGTVALCNQTEMWFVCSRSV